MLHAKARGKQSCSPAGGGSDGPDFPSSLMECSRRMFERQDGCDVNFAVKGPFDASETKIGAHRYVLCSRSPVFYKSLQWGSKAQPDKKLKVIDIPAEIFREILRFVYSILIIKPRRKAGALSDDAIHMFVCCFP